MDLEIEGHPTFVNWLTFNAELDVGLRLKATVEGPLPTLVRHKSSIDIILGRRRFKLLIDKSKISCTGHAEIRAVDEIRTKKKYRSMVFSNEDGTSLGRAIETVCPISQAPPSLYCQVPAIQVDTKLRKLLRDTCARQDWHWWIHPDGLQMGTPTTPAREVIGSYLGSDMDGSWFRVRRDDEESFPMPGETVKCLAREGQVLRCRVTYRRGVVRCELLIGNPTRHELYEPSGERRFAAQVIKLKPLLVRYANRGMQITTRATLMGLAGLGGKFRLRVPLSCGDVGHLGVATRGVTIALPYFYPFHEDSPVADFVIQAPRAIWEVDELVHHARSVRFEGLERMNIDG
jgi:hypothetical protein